MFWKTAALFWNQDNQDSGIWLDPEIWKTSFPKREQAKIPTPGATKPHSTKAITRAGTMWKGTTDAPNCSNSMLTQVHICRGEAGFGFTIFCDSPVRVQSVDVGGPAGHSGLQQGDVILQLNGLLVDFWSSTDLARTIRSCPSQVHLVVQRGTCEQPSVEGGEMAAGLSNFMTDGQCHSLPRTIRHWPKAPASACCSAITCLPADYVTKPPNCLCLHTFIQTGPTSLSDTCTLRKWVRRPRPLSLNCLPTPTPFSSSSPHTSRKEGHVLSPGPFSTTTD
ncbi:uncharacterized protein LOC128762948 isoform X1 [Synchiropus splendidus]|uniref:uncharacterized protein LOC128762948 isoform X1 n=1 Tax=Synchiropus splendidus TaxID=270530 RepID=UPI00237E194D|nr:uncharacterized protein LOC128762948 isoform X1 [Synchiropus splendidus]